MTLAQQFRQEGRQEGLRIGKIQALEEFLSLPVSSSATLSGKSLEELAALHRELHAEYEKRFKQS